MTGEFSIGPETIRPGMGWGYDCAVFDDPIAANEIVGKGTFFWIGASDTWFWVDPERPDFRRHDATHHWPQAAEC
jgi:CubicO group peptidase (beta-lactamase class C family)